IKARMGVLPMGTVNVFARELKLPLGLEKAWKTILRGQELTIDLPRAEFQSNGETVSRYFAQLAGAGLDSRAVALVDWELKKRVGPLAYVAAGLKALGSKQSLMTVTTPVGTAKGEMVLIGNGKFYGGSFTLFTKADLRDGLLNVCVFPKVNWQVLARASLGLVTNRLHQFSGAREIGSIAVTLTADQQTFLQLDGDNVGELPAHFSIQPKALRVIVP
ncbi:MAG: diacylglycerol kinase family protein, partial [Verrucomicrobiota bacterium]